MTTKEEIEKFAKAVERKSDCYFVRIGEEWKLVDHKEFAYIDDEHDLTFRRDYVRIHHTSYLSDVQRNLIDEGDFERFLSVEESQASEKYREYSEEIKESYDRAITHKSY